MSRLVPYRISTHMVSSSIGNHISKALFRSWAVAITLTSTINKNTLGNFIFLRYEDITSQSNFYALAAVYKQIIIGLIVAEIKHYEDLNSEDEEILPKTFIDKSEYGYILSLGVSREYRRNGIASLLLDSFISHLTTSEKSCVKAIFLHVLTTNTTAIKFYEHRHFHLHKFLPYYYSIRGRCRDGFTYVLYINGGHPSMTILYPFSTNFYYKY